jgi:hypothetical protein
VKADVGVKARSDVASREGIELAVELRDRPSRARREREAAARLPMQA